MTSRRLGRDARASLSVAYNMTRSTKPSPGDAEANGRPTSAGHLREYLQRWWRRTPWVGFVHVSNAIIFVIAVGLFLNLVDGAREGDYLAHDQRIMAGLREAGRPLGPEWVAEGMRDLTALGSAVVLTGLTLLIVGYLLLARRHRIALLLAAAIAGGQGLNVGLKQLVARERPEATLHLVAVRSPSFPSGHAMAASIFYLTVGALLARTTSRRSVKHYLMACAILLTVAVGVSRVYLGVHYPTDVLAAWCAGTAWALACWFVADGLALRGSLRHSSSKGSVGT